MSVVQKQREFAQDLGLLLTWGLEELRQTYPGAALRMGEGYVGDTARKQPSPHRRDGGHFKRLATDLVLDINGVWITDSRHPAWFILHAFWAKLRKGNGSGGLEDMNHFGREDGGVV